MKEYLLYDKCADLTIIMIGGMKPGYYIRERIFKFFLTSIPGNDLWFVFKDSKFPHHVIDSRYRLDEENPYIQKSLMCYF